MLFSLNPLGMALAGPLAVAVGIGPTLYAAAIVIVVPCLAVHLLADIRRLGLPAPVETHRTATPV